MHFQDPTLAPRARVRKLALTLLCLLGGVALGCEDEPKPKLTPKPMDADIPAIPVSAPRKPDVAPILEIDTVSPKVGSDRALLQHPEGKAELTKLLNDAKRWLDGKDVVLIVDRKVQVPWVATYLDELGKVGVAKVTIRTDTRKEFSQDQRFVPEAKVQAPPCSVVAMVTSDFATAVWKLSGGTASKRSKGMAGPDLSMTGDTIERFAKGCKDSSTFFLSVAEGVEWGLAFDLGASSRVLEHAKFDSSVLLNEIPTAGQKVNLKH
jgi:biopolymer transport protein ExbD